MRVACWEMGDLLRGRTLVPWMGDCETAAAPGGGKGTWPMRLATYKTDVSLVLDGRGEAEEETVLVGLELRIAPTGDLELCELSRELGRGESFAEWA